MARTLRSPMATWSMPAISVNTLKMMGEALMTLYFFSGIVVQNRILHVTDYTTQQLNSLMSRDPVVMVWAGIASVASVIGVMGIPIFAYLLVQGVTHTANIQRYILTVLAFAVLSEAPYDLAMFGQVWNWNEQNSLWTVFIALVMLWLMDTFHGQGLIPLALDAMFAVAGCFWAVLLNCKFGGGFVLMTAVLYLLQEKRAAGYWLGALIGLIYASAPLGFVPVALCNGRRLGTNGKKKYIYYAFYPILMSALAVMAGLL